ncbi:MAG: PucR family transcriptional regulator [Solirubrobacterales bacterium]
MGQAGHKVADRLWARVSEVEETILTRVYAVSDPDTIEDAEYRYGLRSAIGAAVSHGFKAIEVGEDRVGSVPPAILGQARNAARNRVGLEVVLRRYTAGYAVLCDFLMQELWSVPSPAGDLYRLQRNLTAVFDRLVSAVSVEYGDETERRRRSVKERDTERVRRLLAGELVDTDGLSYGFEGWHLGIIAKGLGTARPLRDLARRLDRQLLLVGTEDTVLWAWFGGSHAFENPAFTETSQICLPPQTSLALGEPARGLRGWRLTHRQAESALKVALRRPRQVTRYGEVALLAGALGDEDLASFLIDTFVAPLRSERDGGRDLRQTLRTYLASGRNVSSAAAALGVTRHTVSKRLRIVEDRLQQSVTDIGGEIDIAMRLADELTPPPQM